jgi:hypothetical protein
MHELSLYDWLEGFLRIYSRSRLTRERRWTEPVLAH